MNYNPKYAEQGLCGYCGKNKPKDGRKKCAVCLMKNRVSQTRTRDRYVSEGVCVYCGKEKAQEGLKGCAACNEKNCLAVKKRKQENPHKTKEWQDKANKKRSDYRLENSLCTQCGKPSDAGRYCNACKIYHAEAQKLYNKRHPEKAREYRRRLRREVIDKYGGKCDCCGEYHVEFLAIDHKNGDGAMERRKLFGSNTTWGTVKWYLKLKREPKRDDLRVLCHNCNMAIGLYGYCPHENHAT